MLYGYIRVSSHGQEDGTSLREQEQSIRAIAMLRGVEALQIAIFADRGVSGSIPLRYRPAGAELLAELKTGDIVVISKLDRMFRSVKDAAIVVDDLARQGVGIIIKDLGSEPLGESPISQLVFQLMSSIAEFERKRIAERCQDGRRSKKKAGGCIGTVPFGYRKRGVGKLAVLELNPAEHQIMQCVSGACCSFPSWSAANFDRKDAQDEIAYVQRKLTDAGLKDRAGHVFRRTQIRRLIARHYAQQFTPLAQSEVEKAA
jgi:putative DNA-invertase from lambdoid prophage Rac